MNKLKPIALLVILISFSSFQSIGQTLSNVNAVLIEDKAEITYDLEGTLPNQKFTISIFYSKDNYSSVLRKVTGDIGPDIEAGFGKKIVWEAKEELKVFTGDIEFEVRALLTYSPLVAKAPVSGTTFKVGKLLPILWEGGTNQDNLQLELFRGGQMARTISPTGNTGSYTWALPKDLKKGSDYAVRILNPARPTEALLTSQFRIKGKTSVVIYLLPLAAVGGAAAFFLTRDTVDDPIVIDRNTLPEPPLPTGN